MGEMIPGKGRTVVTIPSDPKYLCVVRVVTAKLGEIEGLEEQAIEEIKLAVDEACSNVIKHAYQGDATRKIVVKYRVMRKGFEVIIEDNGAKAHMEFLKGRSLDDIRPGGLGMHLIRKAFDVCMFDARKKTGNRLILRRYKDRSL